MPGYIAYLAEEIEPRVDHVPRTATELYRLWADLPEHKTFTRRLRHERRCMAQALERLARQGRIRKDVITNPHNHRTIVGFYRPN